MGTHGSTQTPVAELDTVDTMALPVEEEPRPRRSRYGIRNARIPSRWQRRLRAKRLADALLCERVAAAIAELTGYGRIPLSRFRLGEDAPSSPDPSARQGEPERPDTKQDPPRPEPADPPSAYGEAAPTQARTGRPA